MILDIPTSGLSFSLICISHGSYWKPLLTQSYSDPTPPSYFVDYLNLASTQNALGVNLNYSETANEEVYYAFQQTGDFVYPNFLEDLEMLLANDVRVALFYGDADYICNVGRVSKRFDLANDLSGSEGKRFPWL
jgi:hypothetical protein